MTALSIRNLDEKALQRLKAQAEAEGASVNSLVVRLIETATGVRGAQLGPAEHHDLDALAGTWNEAHASAFERASASFKQIDDALWAAARHAITPRNQEGDIFRRPRTGLNL